MKKKISQEILGEAKVEWKKILSDEDKARYRDLARTKKIRRGVKLEKRAFTIFLNDFIEFKKLSFYRDGAEGMIKWVEDNVLFKITVNNENEQAAVEWVSPKNLPDERDEYGRSYKTLWEFGKSVIREMLRMENGRYVRNLCVLCWPRGETKSFIMVLIGLHRFFCFSYAKVFLTGSSKAQSGNSLLDEMKAVIKYSPKLFEKVTKKGLLQESIVMEKGVNYIKQLSTQSGLVSNASMVIQTEAFEMEDNKFFEKWFTSLRNTVNAMGLIDTTVSHKGHWLYRLWEGYKRNPEGRTFFSYRYSRTGSPRDYNHPEMTERQLDSYRVNLTERGFAKLFLNTWDSGDITVFDEVSVDLMEYVGIDGVLNQDHDLMKSVWSKHKVAERNKAYVTTRNLTNFNTRRQETFGHRFVPISDYYSMGDYAKADKYSIRTGSNQVSLKDINKIGSELQTHWALLLGTDIAGSVNPREADTARTILVAVMKGAPGSMGMSRSERARSDLPYLYLLIGVYIVEDNQPWNVAEAARRLKNTFGHVDKMTGETYSMTPIKALCDGMDINQLIVHASLQNQHIAMGELIRAVNNGRFKAPRVPIHGSKTSDIFREELNAIEEKDGPKGISKYESKEKNLKGGVRDDVIDSVAWAIFGGLELTAANFRERTVTESIPIMGIYAGLPQFQNLFKTGFGLDDFSLHR